MTAASPGPSLFSILSVEGRVYRTQRETFLCSLIGQAVVLGLIVYFTSCVIRNPPAIVRQIPFDRIPVIFSGHNGGGGGNHDPLPASSGNPPRSSLIQLVPPNVVSSDQMHKLMEDQTVMVAPEVKYPEGGQIGDPASPFSKWFSSGPGGPGGIGPGCCDGIGPGTGPYVGDGPPGLFPGKNGVSVPQVIFNPEPSFSEEARKSKTQGIVLLMLIVGKDGRPYDIHVRQSLGMGLDEKAIEAVTRWRFRPGTLNGKPVATQIAVEVDFHLY